MARTVNTAIGNGHDVERAYLRFAENVGSVIVGRREAVELVFVALLCEGHVLIEDLPGVGKTQLAKAAAWSLGCSFHRIQCTPDLLPSDITGVQFFNQKTCEFEFHPGPVMANIVVVDEINRAMPRTQSCLLECMQERQITVDLETRRLPRPFMILATQNPIELEGTFPLPEAQLDRFLFRITLGYPSVEEEEGILSRYRGGDPIAGIKSVIERDELYEFQKACLGVHMDPSLRTYILTITRRTRDHREIRLGASPRASLGFQQAAHVLAAVRGRDYILPDDIKELAVPVLAHRIILATEAKLKGRAEEAIIREILSEVPVPTEKI